MGCNCAEVGRKLCEYHSIKDKTDNRLTGLSYIVNNSYDSSNNSNNKEY